MRIEYQLTSEELKEFSRGRGRHLRRVLFFLTGCAILVSAVSFALRRTYCWPCPIFQAATPLQEYAPWIAVFFAIWLTTFSIMRSGAGREWEQRSSLRVPKTVEFLPDRVYVVDAITRAEYLWAAIGQVIETRNTFAFMVDNSPAFIVPKRSMGSPDTVGACRSLLLSVMPGRLRSI